MVLSSLVRSSTMALRELLEQCGLSAMLPTLEEEELTIPLLRSMSDLQSALLELGIVPADAAKLEKAVRGWCSPRPSLGVRPSSPAPPVSDHSVSRLLRSLDLERYTAIFEEEAIENVSLLSSMGSALAHNLRELGLDDAAVGALTAAMQPSAASNVRAGPTAVPSSAIAPRRRSDVGGAAEPTLLSSAAKPAPLAAAFINLASRIDRRTAMEATLAAVDLIADRFDAITDAPARVVGSCWDTSLNAKFDRNCRVDKALTMSTGERGCAASHAALWQRCAASDAPLLVLEDDLVFETPHAVAHTQRLVRAIEAVLAPDERRLLLYLGAEAQPREASMRGRQALGAARAANVPHSLEEVQWAWQTHAYVIWPAAARLLLEGLPIDAPADVFLSRHFYERRLCALVARPPLARQVDPYRGGNVQHSSLREREQMSGMWNALLPPPAESSLTRAQHAD